MTSDQFCDKYPRLYHMATAEALPQIEKYGLMSTQATLDLLEIIGDERNRLITQRRPRSVPLTDNKHGSFVLRDQIPTRDAALARCLKGMSIPEWYRMLNERVFMWATRKRVETLLAARAYRNKKHLVLTIDTEKLVAVHRSDLRLSSINSGATLYNPPTRGRDTFCPLGEYESLNGRKPIAEVTVIGSIPRMKEFIVDATVREGAK